MRTLAAAIALCGVAFAAGADCAPGRVEFSTSSGIVAFRVETARSEPERARGLMNRGDLAPDAGMLFVFPAPVRARFWMRDTLIPLDMIFVDSGGTVRRVKARARPMDDTIIDGGAGVRFVVEVNGGEAARHGIGPGTRMRSPEIDQSGAVWRCGQS